MSADYYLEQAEACRLERHRLEKYDSYFYFIGISFEYNRIKNIIHLYDKAAKLYLEQKNPHLAIKCSYESAYLCQYLRLHNKASMRYIDAAYAYLKIHDIIKMDEMCGHALDLYDLCDYNTKRILRIESGYLYACVYYEDENYMDCISCLEGAIRYCNMDSNFTERIIKVYEKLVFLYVMKMNKPALAITLCETIIRLSTTHKDFYSKLRTQLMEKNMADSCHMLEELVQ